MWLGINYKFQFFSSGTVRSLGVSWGGSCSIVSLAVLSGSDHMSIVMVLRHVRFLVSDGDSDTDPGQVRLGGWGLEFEFRVSSARPFRRRSAGTTAEGREVRTFIFERGAGNPERETGEKFQSLDLSASGRKRACSDFQRLDFPMFGTFFRRGRRYGQWSPRQVSTRRADSIHGWSGGTVLVPPAASFKGTLMHASRRTATMTL